MATRKNHRRYLTTFPLKLSTQVRLLAGIKKEEKEAPKEKKEKAKKKAPAEKTKEKTKSK